MADPVFII